MAQQHKEQRDQVTIVPCKKASFLFGFTLEGKGIGHKEVGHINKQIFFIEDKAIVIRHRTPDGIEETVVPLEKLVQWSIVALTDDEHQEMIKAEQLAMQAELDKAAEEA